MDKGIFRQHLKVLRANISEREKKTDQILTHLKGFKLFQKSKFVLLYYPDQYDVDMLPVINTALQSGKRVYLPFIATLTIGEIHALSDVVTAEYFMKQPTHSADPDSHMMLDLVIMPGIGFDRRGVRVGHGTGWYDRFLKEVPDSVPRVGVCFEEQLGEMLPRENHDEPVDFIVTEKGIHKTDARGDHFEQRYL
jgi:5-formyltetrahydrofolate cyclo-ligase